MTTTGISTGTCFNGFMGVTRQMSSLKTSLISTVGGSITLIRASSNSVTDNLGAVHMAKSGEARFYGARRTENLCQHSEDFVTGWTVGSGVDAPVAMAGLSLRTGRESIKMIARTTGGSNIITRNSAAYRPGQHTYSIGLATGNGTDTVRLRIEDQATSTLLAQVDVVPSAYSGPASMRTYAVFGTIPNTQNYRFIVTNPNPGASTIYVDGALIQYTHGRSGGVPDNYVAIGVGSSPWYGANVDGVQYWDTTCGNTISSGLVTFAAGSAISESTMKGLMVERGTVNGLFSSRDLNAGEWTKYQVTAGALADSVALGANSLRKMAEDNTLNSHRIGQVYRSTTPNDNTRMTVSCYVKAAERDIVRIGFINKAGTVNLAYFNLTTATVSNISGGAEVEAYMYQVGDCYRLAVTGSAGTGATAIEALYGLAQTAGTSNYTGTTGSGAFFGGFQFEPVFVATAYHGDTAAASTLTSVGDNAYISAASIPSDQWEIGMDFTPFFNSNSNNKPSWVYLWYARTDVNNRHGFAIRPGAFGGFVDGGSDDWVYDLYNGDDETSWDGVDLTTGAENAAPLGTKTAIVQMHKAAATGASNLRGKIGSSTMTLTVAGVHNINTTPATTYLRFGINDSTIGQTTALYHSICVKNFYIYARPVTTI
jgi:hypothetical protein